MPTWRYYSKRSVHVRLVFELLSLILTSFIPLLHLGRSRRAVVVVVVIVLVVVLSFRLLDKKPFIASRSV